MYAIYHLARSSKGRTPASSASYMLFAAVLDVSLIPFLTFTAFMARTEYIEPDIVPGNWTALFGGSEATASIIYATFLTSVVTGSLHLVSLVISIYLGKSSFTLRHYPHPRRATLWFANTPSPNAILSFKEQC